MGDRDALIRAVLANPADDLPRLVFADWCDENGEPARAEFVRLQCHLAKLAAEGLGWPFCVRCSQAAGLTGPTPRCRGPLCRAVRRERDLLARHKGEWDREALAGPLGEWEAEVVRRAAGPPRRRAISLSDWVAEHARPSPDAWLFDRQTLTYLRGFPAEVRCDLAVWLTHGPAVASANPVGRVVTTDAVPFVVGPNGQADVRDHHAWFGRGLLFPDDDHRRGNLPEPLFRSLEGGRDYGFGRYYPTPAAAEDALSDALIAFARRPDLRAARTPEAA